MPPYVIEEDDLSALTGAIGLGLAALTEDGMPPP